MRSVNGFQVEGAIQTEVGKREALSTFRKLQVTEDGRGWQSWQRLDRENLQYQTRLSPHSKQEPWTVSSRRMTFSFTKPLWIAGD